MPKQVYVEFLKHVAHPLPNVHLKLIFEILQTFISQHATQNHVVTQGLLVKSLS